ncbi:hypothetical protein [Streptomyces sp. NPDC015125]|uniref:hypothetical protein n=1 Tax=Streptomyces sp. NPDC015125 TaxID=3364938 RepID=UPI0036FF6994
MSERIAAESYGFTRDQYRLYVAIHELGHAVAGISEGYDYRKVTVRLDGGHSRTRGSAYPSWWGKKERIPQLVSLHGGFIANEIYLKRNGLWDPRRKELAQGNARSDYSAADNLKPSRRETEDAIFKARRHLERHWTVIDYAAPELAKKGQMSFRQLRSVPGW